MSRSASIKWNNGPYPIQRKTNELTYKINWMNSKLIWKLISGEVIFISLFSPRYCYFILYVEYLRHDFFCKWKMCIHTTHTDPQRPSECSRKWIWSQFQPVAVLYLPDKSFMAYNFSLIIILMAGVEFDLSEAEYFWFFFSLRFVYVKWTNVCIDDLLFLYQPNALHPIRKYTNIHSLTHTLNTVIAIYMKIETKKLQNKISGPAKILRNEMKRMESLFKKKSSS